jgi:hypothetical protein
MKNPFPILLQILKAPSITLKVDDLFYDICTKSHPKLKIIPNKKYLVALMKEGEFKTDIRKTYEVRKSLRNGNRHLMFNASDYIDRVIEINLSDPERQGKRIPEYMYDSKSLRKHFGDKLIHGIFKNGVLIAYADVNKFGDIFVLSPFIGHAEYLKEGIMYHLFDQVSINRPLMYDTFLGNTEGLAYFKTKLGFKPYNVKWMK